MAESHRIFVGYDGVFPYGGGNDVLIVQPPLRDSFIFLNGNNFTTLSGDNLVFL